MRISYRPLWVMLAEREITKKQHCLISEAWQGRKPDNRHSFEDL